MVAVGGEGGGMMPRRSRHRVPVPPSAFHGFRFPPEIIVLAVRGYFRYGLSYRDVEELLAERGIEVDHVTIFRWVQRFTPQCPPCRRSETARCHRARWNDAPEYAMLGGMHDPGVPAHREATS
jgi:hypothetical protein